MTRIGLQSGIIADVPARGLLLFCLTGILATLAVAAFGWRSVRQERRLAALERQERLDLAAEVTARKLERLIRDWTWRLDPVRFQKQDSQLPEPLRAGGREAGAWVLLWHLAEGAVVSWPQERLLYVARSGRSSSTSTAHTSDRGTLRSAHGRARALRSAGDLSGALAAFRALAQSGGTVAGLPAGLVGQYEACDTLSTARRRADLSLCATEFYRALVTSRWSLTPEQYAFYEAAARTWHAEAGAGKTAWATLDALGARKHALSAAARTLPSSRCNDDRSSGSPDVRAVASAIVVAWCRPTADGSLPGALVFERTWFSRHVWPAMSAEVSDALHLALSGPESQSVWAASSTSLDQAIVERTGTVAFGDFRLHVWDRDTRALQRSLVRQRWSMATVALTLVSLFVAAGATGWALRRQLQTAQMKADFVATVSHELQTPVTALRQMGELLVRGRVPEARRREYYERITSEADRLGRLIAQILDMARGDAGHTAYRFERLDAVQWLREALAAFALHHGGTETRVTSSVPPVLPALHADRAAITSALHNLLDNAVKYSHPPAVVVVTAREDDASVVIEVTDQGVGMTAEEQRLAFERFYRGHRHVASGPAGTGIGLSLVRQIVRAHDGSIDVSSRLGQGATFTMRLPAAPARA